MPWPGVAPYGLNWSSGFSRLHSRSSDQSEWKCSGMRQLLAFAQPSTCSMMRPARLRQVSSPVTSATARNASTECMLALRPRYGVPRVDGQAGLVVPELVEEDLFGMVEQFGGTGATEQGRGR